jgi:hypothetical protein
MKRHLACILAAPLFACVEPAVATAPSNNANIEVDTLFTHDGCTVYRFHDGTYHYFVRCRDAQSASTLSRVPCGKNCTRPDEIPTVVAPPAP